MFRYIIVRTIQGLVALFVLSIVIFLLARISGDPVLMFLPPDASMEDYYRLQKHFGLDKPLHVQYGIFITNAVKGDFGDSIYGGRSVTKLIGERVPNSLKLIGAGAAMAIVISIPLGVMAAVKRGGFLDKLARILAGLGQSLPAFWFGLMLMLIFGQILGWLPICGMRGWTSYLMPAFCVAYFLAAGIIRLLRSSMLDIIDSEYIKMARIKGLSEGAIIWKHALRNSLLPVLSFGGAYMAILLSGNIVTEVVFAWPGFGRLAYQAILTRDFPLMQGVVLTAGAFVIGVNLLTDILYAYLDPRIRYGQG